jgi:predicted Zn-dependent peptidase
MESKVFRLKNGIRLVYTFNQSPVSHCAILVDAGTRDEPAGKEGVAHFLEHIFFKGTKRRKAYQVLNRLETVGGEINAFTTREDTCIHATFMSEFYERAVELISDIFFNSQFPDKEIEREKEVVIDEINSYLDNPMEQVMDDFESQVFRGNPLGNPILGTHQTVKNYKRTDLLRFIKNNYNPEIMVFSYNGNLSFDVVKKTFQKYFDVLNLKNSRTNGRVKFRRLKTGDVTAYKPIVQAHYMLGGTAYSATNNKRIAMFLLNNILGGPGLNSRLNMNIREKHGYTYHIESSYVPFSDTGLFSIYLATEKKYLEKSIRLVQKEMHRLMNNKISANQLNQYKNQLIGQLSIGMENQSNVMINHARSMIAYDRPVSFNDTVKNIKQLTSENLIDTANRIFDPKSLGSLIFLPSEP